MKYGNIMTHLCNRFMTTFSSFQIFSCWPLKGSKQHVHASGIGPYHHSQWAPCQRIIRHHRPVGVGPPHRWVRFDSPTGLSASKSCRRLRANEDFPWFVSPHQWWEIQCSYHVSASRLRSAWWRPATVWWEKNVLKKQEGEWESSN